MRPAGEQANWVAADVHANRELLGQKAGESAQDDHLAVSKSRESKK